MKKILSFVIYVLLTHSAFALTNDPAHSDNLSVKINLDYKNKQKNISDQYIVNNQVEMETNNPQWVIVRNEQPAYNNNQFVLLSKIEKASTEQLTFSFLLLETGKNPALISSPRILVRYGQQGVIDIDNKNTKMHLSVLANK